MFLHQGTMDTLNITVDRHKVRPNKENKEEYNRLMLLTTYHLAKDQLQGLSQNKVTGLSLLLGSPTVSISKWKVDPISNSPHTKLSPTTLLIQPIRSDS